MLAWVEALVSSESVSPTLSIILSGGQLHPKCKSARGAFVTDNNNKLAQFSLRIPIIIVSNMIKRQAKDKENTPQVGSDMI